MFKFIFIQERQQHPCLVTMMAGISVLDAHQQTPLGSYMVAFPALLLLYKYPTRRASLYRFPYTTASFIILKVLPPNRRRLYFSLSPRVLLVLSHFFPPLSLSIFPTLPLFFQLAQSIEKCEQWYFYLECITKYNHEEAGRNVRNG